MDRELRLPENPATRRQDSGFDGAMLVAPHTSVDLDLVRANIFVLVDMRGVLRADPSVVQA